MIELELRLYQKIHKLIQDKVTDELMENPEVPVGSIIENFVSSIEDCINKLS